MAARGDRAHAASADTYHDTGQSDSLRTSIHGDVYNDNRTVYHVEGDLHIYQGPTHYNCSLIDDDTRHRDATETARRGLDAITFMPYQTLKLEIIRRLDQLPVMLSGMVYLCRSDRKEKCGVPKEIIDQVRNGQKFLDVLEECCLLSAKNVLYLQFLLQKIAERGHHCVDLCEEVQIYAEKYKEDFNTLYFHSVYKSKASGTFVTEIEVGYEIHGDTTHFVNLDATGLTEVLASKLGIPPRLVHIVGVKKGSVILAIQLPLFYKNEGIKNRLRCLMKAKDIEWIERFNIIGIHVAKDKDYFTFKKQPKGTEQSMGQDTGFFSVESQNSSVASVEDRGQLRTRSYSKGRPNEGPSVQLKPKTARVKVVFHTILSPEFKYDEEKQEVVVRMGGSSLGCFLRDCVKMKTVRRLEDNFLELQGAADIACSTLKDKEYRTGIPYTYCVRSKQLAKYQHPKFEAVSTQSHSSVRWYRCLRVPSEFREDKCVWKQYDSVMETTVKAPSGYWEKGVNLVSAGFKSMVGGKSNPKEPINRELLAFKTYLPKWHGFVTTGGEPMKVNEALEQVDRVCECLTSAKIMTSGNHPSIEPDTEFKFVGKLLSLFLADKIASFAEGTRIDDDGDDSETRIKSALAILHLARKHDMELSLKDISHIFEGLRLPTAGNDTKIISRMMENVKKELGITDRKSEHVTNLQEKCETSLRSGTQKKWILALPLLHFLRGDCLPYQELPSTAGNEEHLKKKWWGIDWCTLHTLNCPDMSYTAGYVTELLDVDPLLERSLLWLALKTTDKLPMFYTQHKTLFQRMNTESYLHAFHLLVATRRLPTDEQTIKGLTNWINILLDRSPISNLRETNLKNIASLTGDAANNLVKMLTSDKAKKTKHYDLVFGTCRLFATYYIEAAQLSAKSLTSTKEFGYANSLLHEVKKWLLMYLPAKLSHTGKELVMPEELQIWSDLLSLEQKFVGLEWKQQLSESFAERLKALPPKVTMNIFHWDASKFHPEIGTVCSAVTFASIDKKDHNSVAEWFAWLRGSTESEKEKNGRLLSKVLCDSWPSNVSETDLLIFLLTWTSTSNFLTLQDEFLEVFTETARHYIDVSKHILQRAYDDVISGSIAIKTFNLITQPEQPRIYQQFVELYRILHPGGKEETIDIGTMLDIRKRELKTFGEHVELNKTLCRLCDTDNIGIDTSSIKSSLDLANDDSMKLNAVCNPIKPDAIQQLPECDLAQVDITFFSHSDEVQQMLHPLALASRSVIFRKLWTNQAYSVKDDENEDNLTIDDVERDIWREVKDDLMKVRDDVRNADIKLEDVDSLFEDMKLINQLRDELRKVCIIFGEENSEWIEERTKQIIDYRSVQRQSEVAKHMLTMQKSFDLQGDFQPLQTLSEMVLPSSKAQPLHSINENVINASEAIQKVSGKQLRCLEEAAKALKFIEFIRNEIQDVHQLKTFVDLALISAGETDLEIDRVWCFHGAAMGYAPIIFDLKKDSGSEELLEACKKVWGALENDPELPLKMRDAKKYIHWLRRVKVQQRGGEVRAVSQLDAINSRGTYIIGKLQEKSTEVKGRDLQNEKLLLIVKGSKGEGMAMMTEEKIYTVDELQDLQGKLNLVVGKKQKQGSHAKIEYFIEVFTLAQQLADAYEKLCKAGCLLFSEWKLTLYCQRLAGKVSVHVDFGVGKTKLLAGTLPLRTEMDGLRDFMKKCYEEWMTQMDKQRSAAYHLNYFNTPQIAHLRKSLAVFRKDETPSLDAQTIALLCCVKSGCTIVDVQSAAESILGPRVQSEATSAASTEDTKPKDTPEDAGQKKIRTKLKQQGYADAVISASFEGVGKGKPIKDYKKWIKQHGQEVSQEVTHRRQSHQAAKGALVSGVTDDGSSLHGRLTQIWDDYINTMERSDLEDCLSLQHVGKILAAIADTGNIGRTLPEYMREGEPNLLVRSPDHVIPTLLSIYERLPSYEEILMCSRATTYEQVDIFWRRALSDQRGRVFCLVRADLLDYHVSVEAEKQLHHLMRQKHGYKLVVLCSSEQDESSHFVNTLNAYRRDCPDSKPDDIRKNLYKQLQDEVRSTSKGKAAQDISPHSASVEVIFSRRSGVGKSLQVHRRTEAMREKLLQNKQDILEPLCITVPLHEAYVKEDDVIAMLLPHQMESTDTSPRVFHIDVAPMVRHGLDHFLFMLLVAGGLCDSQGRLWRRNPQDLYIIEVTEFGASHNESSNQPLHSLLPKVTCNPPLSVKDEFKNVADQTSDWHPLDPMVDCGEFRGTDFQLAYQYLRRLDAQQDLDGYTYTDSADVDVSPESFYAFVDTLLKHCGIQGPSWTELKHFARFLSVQLIDCQNSVYCKATHQKDAGLKGFKGFVVRFLVEMSRDFATPSLELSEEEVFKKGADKSEDMDENNHHLPVMKRKWESRAHPYLFFNEDGQTMTFLGVNIGKRGQLIDPASGTEIEDFISTTLKTGLETQGVDLSCSDMNGLEREEKLQKLRIALSVQGDFDPDKTYELTSDNMQKMLAINMKFRCDIPIVVMGETGCGKTRLISFLCRLKAGRYHKKDEKGKSPQNMLLMKVHGGTTVEHVRRKVQQAETIAKENKEKYNMDTILFFDEANTTEAIGLIKEIMCDRRALGRQMNMAGGSLKIIAACNPYRRHDEHTVKKLNASGLGYRVKDTDVKDKLGAIPLRELVYRVHALPPSVRPLVWDFGQLSDDVEALYIRQIVQRYMNDDYLKITPGQADVITHVLSESQMFMRSQKAECSFVSLRDVERSLEVLAWFENQPYLNTLLDNKFNEVNKQKTENLDQLTRSLILAVGACYHAGLHESRSEYRKAVATKLVAPCQLHGGPNRIADEISRCQDVFLDEVELEPFIARNSALKENVFMMLICAELRIPLFLVGKPGSSKSLAKTIISKAMQGEASGSELFRKLKQVHMISYQCSPLSTPEGIVNTFRQCSRFQEGRDLEHFVSVVVLDEIGLAEDSPKMPLKSLHPLLETGSDEDELDVPKHKKVAFIGISNWALDPAKMNRGIAVSRDEPDENELQQTARGICATDPVALEAIDPIIPALAKAYLELYQNQEKQFFGLRDYYSLIKMIFSSVKSSEPQSLQQDTGLVSRPTQQDIEHAVRRNFGGLLGANDPLKIFRDELQIHQGPQQHRETSAQLLKASLEGSNTPYGESRYLLVITENLNATLPILEQQLLRQFDASVIFGSSFEFDQEFTQVCKDINRVKRLMEVGKTVVLLNMENLYESLYDALNQYYVYFGGQRYVDLGLGTNRFKCRVDKNFRLVVLADKNVVHERFPPPLLNRLEKHFLATESMLTDEEKAIQCELDKWVKNFSTINMAYMGKRSNLKERDAFVGFNNDMVAALVFQASLEVGAHSGDDQWKQRVTCRVKRLLLECATPEAIIRVRKSIALSHEADDIFDMYFTEQHHRSLQDFLNDSLKENRDKDNDGIMVQVTTHSRVLVREDFPILAGALEMDEKQIHDIRLKQFKTQNEFCTEIREVFEKCVESEQILLIQCEDADENNDLIVCAAYCVHEEKKQAREAAKANMKPAHVILVNQLPRVHRRFQGFQGGAWDFTHIDDLKDSLPDRPMIANLKGRSVGSLLRHTEEAVVDSTMLMSEGFLDAMSRVSDNEQCTDLAKPRRERLRNLLFESATEDKGETKTFLNVAKLRLALLLDEMDTKKGSTGDAWLTTEALAVTEAHRGGTFRRAIWYRLVSIVSPLASELYAFTDYNENLKLLETGNSWQQRLWLAIFEDEHLSPSHYIDFVSPKDNVMRDRAPVKVMGAGDRHFAGKVPFSWLLKENMETKYRTALEKKANTNQPVAKLFRNQVTDSPWNTLLSEEGLISSDDFEDFVKAYMQDFINMVYRFRTNDEESRQLEQKCVFEELLLATTEAAEQLDVEPFANIMETLVAVHLAYHRLENVFYNFARLVDTNPDVINKDNSEILTTSETDKTLDVKVLILIVKSLEPQEGDLDQGHHTTWVKRVKAAKPIIDNVIESVVVGKADTYGDLDWKDFDDIRSIWLRISLLILFYERVCSDSDVPPCLFDSATEFWEDIDIIENPVLQSYEDIIELERSLQGINVVASKELFGHGDEECPVCQGNLRTPVKLPCGHFVCDQSEDESCLENIKEHQNSKCPECSQAFAADFEPNETAREAKEKFKSFKSNVNAFFLDVVSLHCFVYNKPPDAETIARLLAIVTKFDDEDSQQYKSDIIDPDAVARSVVLQLLLQTSRVQVVKYLNNYLKKMQDTQIDKDPEEIKEVCLVFIQCIENQLNQNAFKHVNLEEALVELAADKLKESCEWLIQKGVEQGLSVEYLESIAFARYGITITAQRLHLMISEGNTSSAQEQHLYEETREFFKHNKQQGCSFMVRQICRSYGIAKYKALLQKEDLKQWIAPAELNEWSEDIRDNFVVCGDPYNTFREKLARDLIKDRLIEIPSAVQNSNQDQAAAVALLLSIYQEVTSQYAGSSIPDLLTMQTRLVTFSNNEGRGSAKDTEFKQEFAGMVKGYAEDLIYNRIGQKSGIRHLEVRKEQSSKYRMLSAFVIHAVQVLRCKSLPHLLQPLRLLLTSPSEVLEAYFPTMPDDLLGIQNAVGVGGEGITAWLVCPNGHLYSVGNCGGTVVKSTCPNCGAEIGGENYQLAKGNKKIDLANQRFTGHILGPISANTSGAVLESSRLTSTVMAIERAILHATMIGSAVTENKCAKDVKALIYPEIVQEQDQKDAGLVEFLWEHLSRNIDQLSAACGKSEDDCFFILHMVLHNMISTETVAKGEFDWSGSERRNQWEMAFAEHYVSPVLKSLNDQLEDANKLLEEDDRFKNNPVTQILYRQEMTAVSRETLTNLHTSPIVWQYWPNISLRGVQLFLDQEDTTSIIDPNAKGPFAVLKTFLREEHVLQHVRHLPDIIHLQQLLIDRFNRRVDVNEAKKTTIQEFLNELQSTREVKHEELKRLVNVFITSWNQLRETIAGRRFGDLQVPRDLGEDPIDTSSPLAILLPTSKPPGVCSTALAVFLARTHNEFMESYNHLKENDTSGSEPMKASDATQSHLVAFHPERELLPLVLAHSKYKMEADKGTQLTYDLIGIQKQVEDRFIVGRPKLAEKIEQLAFRQDARSAETFRRIRSKIRQEPLENAVQQGILSDFRSFADLCDSVDTLDIAIGFVESTDQKGDMFLREYLVNELTLPTERGIRSLKANENCHLKHLLALWHLLAVERAKRMEADEHNPFEGIGEEFCLPVPEDPVGDGEGDDLRTRLESTLKYIKVEQFVAELFEYIILELKGSMNDDQESSMEQWSLIYTLNAYVEQKEGEEIRGLLEFLPPQLQVRHAVDTWMIAAKYLRQPKAQQKQ